MQGKRPEREHVCGCDRTDESCAALTVRQLSQERARELAEEIWARSTGLLLPGGPIPDPRRSRPVPPPSPPTGVTGSWSARAGVPDGRGG
jgi:hypothetical protein